MWERSSIRTSFAIGLAVFFAGAEARSQDSPLKIAAASDLALAWKELGTIYEKASGQKVIFSFGSTGLLAKQIEQGAPFDVFAAANVSFVDEVAKAGACDEKTKAFYARGRIVVWTQKGKPAPKSLAELADAKYVKIAIANPEHAPYGKAGMQALESAGLVAKIKPKLVYGENVLQTMQYAQSGNVEAAIVALSLAIVSDGNYLEIAPDQHQPIDQAMVACGKRAELARKFMSYVNSAPGRTLMRRYGFLLPGEALARSQ
jgi:molybdate transport system substrate-binding protein